MGYKKTKYKSEAEMCEEVTMLISAMLFPTKHKHIPEVPRSSHNNHSDMLFIKNNGSMFVVEYKLAGVNDLRRQVQNHQYKIGVINQRQNKNDNKDWQRNYHIFPYTGEDNQLEKLSMFLNGLYINRNGSIGKHNPFGHDKHDSDVLMIYWWAYMHSKSSLLGGIQNGKRESFFEIYKRAIVNLQAKYNNNLDFDLVHSVLGFYGKANARRHYNDAMKK